MFVYKCIKIKLKNQDKKKRKKFLLITSELYVYENIFFIILSISSFIKGFLKINCLIFSTP